MKMKNKGQPNTTAGMLSKWHVVWKSFVREALTKCPTYWEVVHPHQYGSFVHHRMAHVLLSTLVHLMELVHSIWPRDVLGLKYTELFSLLTHCPEHSP
jgi:hypothetical protein